MLSRSWKTSRHRARRWFARSISRLRKCLNCSIGSCWWRKAGQRIWGQWMRQWPSSLPKDIHAHQTTTRRTFISIPLPQYQGKRSKPRNGAGRFAILTRHRNSDRRSSNKLKLIVHWALMSRLTWVLWKSNDRRTKPTGLPSFGPSCGDPGWPSSENRPS